MTMRIILLRLKNELETSINAVNAAKRTAIGLENYQAAADFQNQNVGKFYAIALINQELEYLEDKE